MDATSNGDADGHRLVACAVAGCPSHAVALRPLARISPPAGVDLDDGAHGADPDRSVPLCLVHFRELALER